MWEWPGANGRGGAHGSMHSNRSVDVYCTLVYACVSLSMCVCVMMQCAQICIMKMLRHDHVVRLFGKRECGDIHYLFLEYADGGELFDRIGKGFQMVRLFVLYVVPGAKFLHG